MIKKYPSSSFNALDSRINAFLYFIFFLILIFFLSIVDSSGLSAFVKQDDLERHNIQFYGEDDCSDSSTITFGGDLPAETIAIFENGNIKGKYEQNKERYEYAEKETGVPRQVLAAIHFREGGMDPSKSIADGSPLTSGVSLDGLPISSDPNIDTANQANHFKSNSAMYGLNPNTASSWKTEDWAKALLAYNRGVMYRDCQKGEKPYTDSPYVMNYLDKNHIGMTWNYCDSHDPSGNKLNNVEGIKDANPGALAVMVYLGYDLESGNQLSSPGECINSVSEGNGDVARTAIELSWPEGPSSSRGKFELKPEYDAALSKLNKKSHGCGPAGADCGVFVSTVMKYSGADTDFPEAGTSIMSSYMKGNPAYESIENKGDTSNLQPGDIFVVNSGSGSGALGHIMIYVGTMANDGGKSNAAASCSERVADRGSDIYFGDSRGSYEIYRKKA